eukprot:4473462-Prymnesium_polylepis.2
MLTRMDSGLRAKADANARSRARLSVLPEERGEGRVTNRLPHTLPHVCPIPRAPTVSEGEPMLLVEIVFVLASSAGVC